ncbi:hypothetical protein MORE_26120 [Moorella thermoacetica]|nr:hypothetical protein MORE_26120 [Moorella thermoacetica]
MGSLYISIGKMLTYFILVISVTKHVMLELGFKYLGMWRRAKLKSF